MVAQDVPAQVIRTHQRLTSRGFTIRVLPDTAGSTAGPNA